MNPWDVVCQIVGWVLLTVLALWALGEVITFFALHRMHVRTRRDEPKAGDLWVEGRWVSGGMKDRELLRIKRIADNGRIVIESDLPGSSKVSWSDSPDEWERRVKTSKLWRAKP